MRALLYPLLLVGCASRLHVPVVPSKLITSSFSTDIAPIDPEFTPNEFIQSQYSKHHCSLFGLSFDLKTILLKHLLLKEGGKCKVFDLDRFQCFQGQEHCKMSQAVWSQQLAKLPRLYIGGQSFGGLLEVQGLEAKPGSDALKEELEHSHATMVSHCPPGLHIVKKPCKKEPCFYKHSVKSYIKDLMTMHRCMVFTNSRFCNDMNEDVQGRRVATGTHHICHKSKRKSLSSEVENMLLDVGAKCHVIDLFRDTINKPFIRIVSPKQLEHAYIEFEQAYFGAEIGNFQGRRFNFKEEAKTTSGFTAEVIYSRIQCYSFAKTTEEDQKYLRSFKGKIVLVDRGNCKFVDKALMVQRNGGLGMILVNNQNNPLPLHGISKHSITIWALSIKKSAGMLLKQALTVSPVLIEMEEGGRVERSLTKSHGYQEVPELYLDGLRVGGEHEVQYMFDQGVLIPSLEKAGAFDFPPGSNECRKHRMALLMNAEHHVH